MPTASIVSPWCGKLRLGGLRCRTYLRGSSDHVINELLDSVDCTCLTVAAKPHANSNEVALSLLFILFQLLKFAWEVAKVICHTSSGSFDGHNTSLDSDRN